MDSASSPWVRQQTNPIPIVTTKRTYDELIENEVLKVSSDAKRLKLKNVPQHLVENDSQHLAEIVHQRSVEPSPILENLLQSCSILNDDLNVSDSEDCFITSDTSKSNVLEPVVEITELQPNVVNTSEIVCITDNTEADVPSQSASVSTIEQRSVYVKEPTIKTPSKRQTILIDSIPSVASYNKCEYIFKKKPRKGSQCEAFAKHGKFCSLHSERPKKILNEESSVSTIGLHSKCNDRMNSMQEQIDLLRKQILLLKRYVKSMKEEQQKHILNEKTKIYFTKITKLNQTCKYKILSLSSSNNIAILKSDDGKFLQIKLPAGMKKSYESDTTKKHLAFDQQNNRFHLVH